MKNKKAPEAPATPAAKATGEEVKEVTDSFKIKTGQPVKINVELTLAELSQAITGLYSCYDTLKKSELKCWQAKAEQYRSLALELDAIHTKNNFPKVYTCTLSYSK